MPTPTPPYQFIVIARSRGGSRSRLSARPINGLTEAAQAIWRGIEVLEGMVRRARPSAAPFRAAGAVSGTGPRSLIEWRHPRWRDAP